MKNFKTFLKKILSDFVFEDVFFMGLTRILPPTEVVIYIIDGPYKLFAIISKNTKKFSDFVLL
jgi:hypothetical protein